MKNLKKFILILIFLIDFSIACAVKFPRWILDVHSVYPEDVYIAMLGSGKSIEEAKNDSLSQLARYFDSQIVVNTNAKNKMLNRNEEISKEQEINQELNIVSEVTLVAVDYSKAFYYKKEQKYYIVAYLKREETWNQLEDKIKVSLEQFETFQSMSDNSENLMIKFKYAKKANEEGKKFLKYIYSALIINPSKRENYQTQITRISLKTEENSQIVVPVIMKVFGDCENIISASLEKALEKAGFSVNADLQKESYILTAEIKSNEKNEGEVYFVYPEISITLIDSDGTKRFYSFEKKWGKTAGFSSLQVKKKSFLKIAEDLQNFLLSDIESYFLY